MNNPLNKTDPTGHIFSLIFHHVLIQAFYFFLPEKLHGIVNAIIVAVAFSLGGPPAAVWAAAITSAHSIYSQTGDIGESAKSAAISAAATYAFYEVGLHFKGAKGSSANIQYVAAHGMVGGVMSVLQGGKFGHGLASAAVGKALTLGAKGLNLGDGGRFMAATLGGGTGSVITGGKFANGAARAALAFVANEIATGGESAQKGLSRKQCVLNGGGCNFSVSANPKADVSEPLIELGSMSQVAERALSIDKVAAETGVYARLIRAIMYMETTHGYYDVPLSWFGANKSILPMNINVAYWGDAFGSRADLLNPYNNIKGGALMIRAIQANMPSNSSIAQISTVYNNVNATTVSDYGARVSNIYNSQPWK